jgi:hypothetical protein
VSEIRQLLVPRSHEELAFWEPAGRQVRTGTWSEQAEPTLDRIDAALAQGRFEDAAALARHLVVEAQEIHDLYTDWVAAVPRILEREGVAATVPDPDFDPEAEWQRFRAAAEELARLCEEGTATAAHAEDTAGIWRDAHDRHRDLVASRVDVAVQALGEARLGDLWAELQAEGIAGYARYDTTRNPWARSHDLLVQIAIEGMHGHLGGPAGRGEVEVEEHEDRVELRFSPCGSGGRIRARQAFGVTEARHDFAWNEVGVCHYCVHCCVLQQLEPIRRFGYPARVIEPPLRAGDSCTWSVYRDPSLVPEEAYQRVGQRKPGAADG